MNISLLLEMVSDADPDQLVLGLHREHGWTAGALRGLSEMRASWLSTTGVQHVGFLGLNSVAFPSVLYSAARAGLPFVPLNFRLPDEQLRRLLARIAPGIVVADPDMKPRAEGIDGLEVLTNDRFLDQDAPVRARTSELPFVDPDRVAVMLFTSGTTGEPKAALLRHRHLTAYILSTVEFLASGKDEAHLVSVPPYHIAGVAGVLSSLYSGRRVVYLPVFDPDAWVELACAESVTQAMVVPTMLKRIVEVDERRSGGLPALKHLS